MTQSTPALERDLQAIHTLMQGGALAEAESELDQLIAHHPQNAELLHQRGLLCYQRGQSTQALDYIARAIALDDNQALYHANYGELNRLAGNLEAAIEYGRTATQLDPGNPANHCNLGLAYENRGDHPTAETCLATAIALKPDYVEALFALGRMFNRRGRFDEALELFDRVLQLQPNEVAVLCEKANTFLQQERFNDALNDYARALSLDPQCIEALLGIARTHRNRDDYAAAQASALKALELAPDHPNIHTMLGSIYALKEDQQTALAHYNQALTQSPDQVQALLGKGNIHLTEGDAEAAEQCFRRALTLQPNNLNAHYSLVNTRKVKPEDDNVAAMEHILTRADQLSDRDAIYLHYALGKAHNDLGHYERAFQLYIDGGRLKRSTLDYSAELNEKIIHAITAFYSRDKISELKASGESCSSRTPIFVVGMPRSGSTLTEQIIASHPDVYGAGELLDLLELVSHQQLLYAQQRDKLTPERMRILAEQYAERLQQRAPGYARVTDKMPSNYMSIGFIHCALPNARIIHVARHPLASCVSSFSKLFTKSIFYSYDLRELGRNYRNYHQLMQHWQQVLPADAFLNVQYEELVADTEQQAKRIIDFCDLPWDDRCINFHQTQRVVRTASLGQVRQPIYQSSLESWKRYEKFLGPLIEELGELADPRGISSPYG